MYDFIRFNDYRTMVTEKDNGFFVMMRWRHEETDIKITQVKKKIDQLEYILAKSKE